MPSRSPSLLLPLNGTRRAGLPCRAIVATALALGSALGLGIGFAAPASAVTLADNLSQTTGGGLVVGDLNAPGAVSWEGMKFNTTSASIINSVTVKLSNATAATAGTVFFDIYTSDTGGAPGTAVGSVGSIGVSSITAGPANYTFSSNSVFLNPNSSYFLMARPTGFASNTSISWNYTANTSGFDGYTTPIRVRSTNNGASFLVMTPPPAEFLQLQIQASADVPGPLPLLGGAAAFGWSRRLRQRLKAAGLGEGSGSHGG